MNGWEKVVLSDLISIKHGYAFKGEFITDEDTDNLLLTPGNFAIGGGFQFKRLKFYTGAVPSDYVLAAGDVIVTMTDLSKDADTLGYSAKVPQSRYVLLHNQRIGKVVLNSDRADLNFIQWVLRTQDYRNEILSNYTGSTVKHTSPTRIAGYEFLLPPLGEQREIASILGALDDKIELNRQMAATLEEMARALYRCWFVDFDPVKARSEGLVPAFMDEATAALFPDRFGDDGLPAGWELTTIGAVADIVGGATPSTAIPDYWDEGSHAWATPKDLAGMSDAFLIETSRQITDQGLAKIGSGLSPAGSMLLSSRAPIGYRAITRIPVAVNQGFIVIRETATITGIEAYLWCEVHMETILSNANGSTFQEISKKNFRPIPYVLADEPVRRSFDDLVNPMFERLAALSMENRDLANLRDTLLPKLMSGELRVGGAREQVEDAA